MKLLYQIVASISIVRTLTIKKGDRERERESGRKEELFAGKLGAQLYLAEKFYQCSQRGKDIRLSVLARDEIYFLSGDQKRVN